ncbi:MAG: ABC transporter substrate-binding protein [Actinomycetota bacterium]|nr:ABC transporter substrate-binding protein [Actinomycetota bacterium]
MNGRVTRRDFVRGSTAAAAALYLDGCGSSSGVVTGRVRITGGTFGFPSPFAYIAGPGYEKMSFIYDTLLWKDGSGKLLPWLARSVRRSPDGLTYTFRLRDKVRWQDGTTLTAEDVAFTFEYFLRQPLGPLLLAQPFGVKGARALDAATVEIHLDIPAVTFLASVAGALPIIPKHVWSGVHNPPQAQDPALLVGSGPYRLKSYSAGDGSYLFVANDDFFLGRPFVRQIALVPVDDELVALRAGEIDAADMPSEGVGEDALAEFRSNPSYGLVQSIGNFSYPLIWNMGRGGALADVRFRRACAMAFDRATVISRLLSGNGLPGNPGFLPSVAPYYTAVDQYPYDPAAANRLLDSAGYRRPSASAPRRAPDGAELRFTVLTGNSPYPPVLDLVIPAWRRIGVELTPQSVDLPTLFGRTHVNADEMALTLYPGPGGTAPIADPDCLRTFYSSKVTGRLQGAQGYVNPEFDKLADEQLITSDIARRKLLIAKMQQIVAADLPALTLYYPTQFNVFRKRAFDQWYFTPGGFATGLPGVYNKQVFVTGAKTGVAIRRRM